MSFGKKRGTADQYLRRRDLDIYEGPSPSNTEVWLTAYKPLEDFFKHRLASAPLNYNDIETLQELVRKLRKAGAISHAGIGAGVHIHIGAKGHTPQTIRNLTDARERLLQ